MGIFKFCNDYEFLSMEFPSEIEIDGIVYPNAKRAFAGIRFKDDNLKRVCLTADNKVLNHIIRSVHDGPLVEPEFARKPDVHLLRVLRIKFEDKELREKLLATGEEPIIYLSKYDSYLGKHKGQGLDRLGKALMTLRWELRNNI